MITIDGTYGEGGGQIIRSAVALAAITQTPIEILNIRGGRPKPGLQAQHLTAVRAMAELCGAELIGDALGSVYLSFTPIRPVRAGHYRFDIGTAGSCNLVLQTILVPLALAEGPSEIRVTGGTHNPMAPTFHYLAEVTLPCLSLMGLKAELAVESYGFYPKGGGHVVLRLPGGAELSGLNLTARAQHLVPKGHVLTVGLPDHVGPRGEKALRSVVGPEFRVRQESAVNVGPGAAAHVTVASGGGFAGFTGLGERGKPMEKVASEPAHAYLAWLKSGATVDEHLADQLVLPAALAKSPTSYRTNVVTNHLRTMAWLIPQFLPAQVQIDESGRVDVWP